MNTVLAVVMATAALFGCAGVIIYVIEVSTSPGPATEALLVAILGFAVAGVLAVATLLGAREEDSEDSDFSKEIEEDT